MARSWEYSRGRRIAMEVTMCVIFGVTLGLAGLISHHKQQSLRLPLTEPFRQGALWMRLPAGWRYSVNRPHHALTITAIEPARKRMARVIQIAQERLTGPPPSPEDYLAGELQDQEVEVEHRYFKGLHQDGVRAEIGLPESDGESTDARSAPGLYSCAIIPLSNGDALAVTLTLEDIPPFSLSDKDMLDQIADNLLLAAGDTEAREARLLPARWPQYQGVPEAGTIGRN